MPDNEGTEPGTDLTTTPSPEECADRSYGNLVSAANRFGELGGQMDEVTKFYLEASKIYAILSTRMTLYPMHMVNTMLVPPSEDDRP